MAYFFGTTRFSVYVPGSNAWVVSRDMDEADYVSHLYSDDRLEPRFDIFFGKSAPILQALSERHRYRHILQYSANMPTKWKDRLYALSADFPVLKLKEISNATGAADTMLQLLEGEGSQTIATFRVDDDDILSADYLDQLAPYTVTAFHGMAVSLGLGVAAIYCNGEFTELREIKQPLISIGQAYIGRYNAETHKLHLPRSQSHAQIDRYTPTILDSRSHAFVWTHHVNQDTRVADDNAEKAILGKLRKLPAIPESLDISSKFPTL